MEVVKSEEYGHGQGLPWCRNSQNAEVLNKIIWVDESFYKIFKIKKKILKSFIHNS